MTDKRPCTRCGSTEPGHRISLECQVTKRALGDRVVTRVGTEAGVRAGTISRVWSTVQYEVEWDDGHRSITCSTGWLQAEEDRMDFGDEGRRMISEAKRVADGELRCPPCGGTGTVVNGAISHTCLDCQGGGWMTRQEQNLYYGEGGVNDAAEDQAYLDRQAEERELHD